MTISPGNNTVELAGYYGSDRTHALAAWTSTHREITSEREARLGPFVESLAEAGHTVPFEKSLLHFIITCEAATHIQILKHRAGVSVNGESARYRELRDDKYYVPSDWDPDSIELYEDYMDHALWMYHFMLNRLVNKGMDRKRAKESARFMLPYGNQIKLDVTFNFHSFMHFQKLRNSSDAQLEIHNLANKMLELVRATGDFNHSLKGFGY